MPRCLKEANLLKPRVSNQKEIEIHIKNTWKFEEISLTDHANPAVFRRFNLGPRCKSPFPKCVSQAQALLVVSALRCLPKVVGKAPRPSAGKGSTASREILVVGAGCTGATAAVQGGRVVADVGRPSTVATMDARRSDGCRKLGPERRKKS